MSTFRYDPIKRLLDLCIATVGFIFTLPLQLVLGELVRRKLGAPVLFRQKRPGRDGKIFEMVKFRSMIEPDLDRGLISDEDRITSFGAFLRSTSLDELPTLLNVIKGEMSLVGPRPLLPRYTDHMTELEQRRFKVRPGVTGWAQVHGRNNLSWDERLAMDVWYTDNRSLRLDVICLLKTVVSVTRRSNVSVVPSSAMEDLDVERAKFGRDHLADS